MVLGARLRLWRFLVASVLCASPALAQAPSDQPSVSGSLASSKAVTSPELVKGEEPEYPASARAQRLEPTIVLQLSIDEQGAVTNVEVVESAGPAFDEAMIAVARRFQFEPAHRGEKPVKSKVLYKHQFQAPALDVPPAPPPPPKLAGHARIAETAQPLAGARVIILKGDKRLLELVTDASGAFETSALPPGTYAVRIEAEGFEPFSAHEELRLGEETGVTYQLVAAEEDGVATVVVRGVRPSREVTRRTISRHELSRAPGTNGDAFRAIQNMPGVARTPALSGQLVVRGNADQSTPVFVDGLWIPTIYHFGGLSSVVPTEMLDEVNFYPGNFSVRYGRALAGVVDAHLRETRADGKYHGMGQLDFIDARVMAEGPIPGAKGWHFIGGLRRSHVDAWLVPLLSGNDTSIQAAPVYYDYQLIADTRPTPKSYLRIGFLGFDDRFRAVDSTSANSGTIEAASASLGLGTIYQVTLSPKTSAELTASIARSHQRFVFGNVNFDTVATGILTRGELAYKLTPRATLRTGYDILFAPYTSTARLPISAGSSAPDIGGGAAVPSRSVDHQGTFLVPAVYAELAMHPGKPTQIVSGVRVDYSYESTRVDVSPRMTARYDVSPGPRKTTLKAGSGLFYQQPGLLNVLFSDDPKKLRSPRSWQNSLGVEQVLTDHLTLSLEGFYNLLDDLIVQNVNQNGVLAYSNEGTGRIVGGELMLRYAEDERFFGWVSYTLSRSERTNGPGQPSELFYLDQPQILTVLGSVMLGKGWELGTRFRYVTGNLYTPCLGGIFSSTQTSYVCIQGPTNSQRLPPFHQLDVRIDKRFRIGEVDLGIYLDIINVYNRQNPDVMAYNFNYTQHQPASASFPFIPSLGVRVEF
ncbi:MAG TPA: TonB-dependent receptor [Polyangiaceae bacterium]|nr:TonB-dependent receptor [Polyangiaceae bacterium]